jgi:hypothetical protein
MWCGAALAAEVCAYTGITSGAKAQSLSQPDATAKAVPLTQPANFFIHKKGRNS